MSVLSHLSFIQQIFTEVLLCATHCPAGHPGCARHPVTIPQLFPLPSSALSLAALSLAVTTQKGRYHGQLSALVKGRNPAGRKAGPQPPPLFLGTFSFSLGESRGNLVSPCFSHTFKSIYTPHPFAYWHPKAKKEYLDVPRLLRNQPDTRSLVPSSSAFPCDTISCDSKLLLHNPNYVPATILLDF